MLEGHRLTTEQISVAFEVNLENIAILRVELAKAEAFLSRPPGRA